MGTLHIRRGEITDQPVIIELIEEAAAWLGAKGTDQWASPWPDQQTRDNRILAGLRDHHTWLAEDNGTPLATVTCKQDANTVIWDKKRRAEQAAYVSRLVVSHEHAGSGIGAALLHWAGLGAKETWGAQWIRVDVWTTNVTLHDYYRRLGFQSCGIAVEASRQGRPSAARFQKPTSEVDVAIASRFTDHAGRAVMLTQP